jgi:hypothetical protein
MVARSIGEHHLIWRICRGRGLVGEEKTMLLTHGLNRCQSSQEESYFLQHCGHGNTGRKVKERDQDVLQEAMI